MALFFFLFTSSWIARMAHNLCYCTRDISVISINTLIPNIVRVFWRARSSPRSYLGLDFVLWEVGLGVCFVDTVGLAPLSLSSLIRKTMGCSWLAGIRINYGISLTWVQINSRYGWLYRQYTRYFCILREFIGITWIRKWVMTCFSF